MSYIIFYYYIKTLFVLPTMSTLMLIINIKQYPDLLFWPIFGPGRPDSALYRPGLAHMVQDLSSGGGRGGVLLLGGTTGLGLSAGGRSGASRGVRDRMQTVSTLARVFFWCYIVR